MRRAYGPRMTSPQADRRRRIRRTVGAASLATFALAWGVIAGTGSMGHGNSTATAAGGSASSSTYQSQQQSQVPDMTTQQS